MRQVVTSSPIQSHLPDLSLKPLVSSPELRPECLQSRHQGDLLGDLEDELVIPVKQPAAGLCPLIGHSTASFPRLSMIEDGGGLQAREDSLLHQGHLPLGEEVVVHVEDRLLAEPLQPEGGEDEVGLAVGLEAALRGRAGTGRGRPLSSAQRVEGVQVESLPSEPVIILLLSGQEVLLLPPELQAAPHLRTGLNSPHKKFLIGEVAVLA